MDVQEKITTVNSYKSILNFIGESNHYIFHRYEKEKDPNKPGYNKALTCHMSKGSNNDEKNIYKWQKFYNKIINQKYCIPKDVTSTHIFVSTKSPKWLIKFIQDMRKINNFSYVYTIQFQYDNCIIRMDEDNYQIEHSIDINGLAFLDSYDSIRVIRDLSPMFSNIRHKIRSNSDKICRIFSGEFGPVFNKYNINHSDLVIEEEFIKDILG